MDMAIAAYEKDVLLIVPIRSMSGDGDSSGNRLRVFGAWGERGEIVVPPRTAVVVEFVDETQRVNIVDVLLSVPERHITAHRAVVAPSRRPCDANWVSAIRDRRELCEVVWHPISTLA